MKIPCLRIAHCVLYDQTSCFDHACAAAKFSWCGCTRVNLLWKIWRPGCMAHHRPLPLEAGDTEIAHGTRTLHCAGMTCAYVEPGVYA